MTTKQNALNYASNGLKVFPLGQNSKKPRKGSHGWQDATLDKDVIDSMFQNGANVAIATGKSSNLFVLDSDPRHDGHTELEKLEAKYGKLPDTRKLLTAGGGCHYYFTYPEDMVIRNSVLSPKRALSSSKFCDVILSLLRC